MTNKNWERDKQLIYSQGILPIDNVPIDVIDYLKNNISNVSHNHELAGQIKKEYRYQNWPKCVENFLLSFVNTQVMDPIIKQAVNKIKITTKKKPYCVNHLWVNLQKKYEFNPVHSHSGVLSFIIFLKIPYNLEDEDKVFPKTSGEFSASRLCFLINDYMGEILELKINVDKSFENKMLLFPAKLNHLVYPFFTSDEERITVSGNISINTD